MSDDALVALVETVRDEMRAGLGDLRRRVDALAERKATPPWVRTVAVAVASAVAVTTVTRVVSRVQLAPPTIAEVSK